MSSINLTADEATHRSDLITDVHYDVHIDLTVSEKYFLSETTVGFKARKHGSTFIDLRTNTVEAADLDGEPIDVDDYDPTIGLALKDLSAGEHRLTVAARIPYSRTGEGLHRSVDAADGKPYFYTQFETADAKRMFACFDQPDIEATYAFTVLARPEWKVITNEPVESTPLDETATRHTSRIDYPLSTYLVALCAGEYTEFCDTWRGELTHHEETPEGQPSTMEVPLRLFARASIAEHLDAERLFTETKQGFDFYHRNFGMAYPFSKYDQVFVPEFNAGAMENAGCVTIRDEYVFTSRATHYRYERRADTVLHELAHMWFGDLVTMRWWDDLWLNESFATFSAAISQAEETQYDTAWVTFANVEKAWAYAQDQLPTTHPVFTDASDIETVEQNFDGITYAKGASVLKQLQAYVGREAFFAGVRRHFATHAWGNATFDDLLGALAHTSGRDLGFWANQWLKTSGVNHLRADVAIAADGTYERFDIVQTGTPARTHRLAVGVYAAGDNGATHRISRAELDVSGERTPVDELIGTRAGDLILPNDEDLTYALIDLDERSLKFAVHNIDTIADPMARTLCWSAAWEMTRAGEMKARDFLALIARGAGAETELGVLERIVGQAVTALKNYADPDFAESSTLLADALLAGARGENPDAALVFEQALARIPLTDEAAEFFTGLLDSKDAEQRWRATTALVARGDYGEELIEKQARRDETASGRLHAITARAARPDAENKKAVVDELLAGESSNLEARHLMAGLTYVGARETLEQFNDTYFEVAERLWREFSSEMALRTLSGIFPAWNITDAGIDKARGFLERDLPAGLKRLTTELLDHLERAHRLRQVDAA
ncbi:aminopeptidase N [Corynebacterium yudongzhengii]|uniref:Aminopeptidase N n=1 Tax=Corynebacterium yudongzhengii TaxID=2080740 RepID=A0A2U1T8X1_9CORY|nr:aminopeptidase N [Corynebacterium yudongzhengii]AWB82512.1 aminopeptidase N [Corynebacterium yudongzhengii]PWC02432.1 aminopeptidase N [Corynebacterium yudongzhengii]